MDKLSKVFPPELNNSAEVILNGYSPSENESLFLKKIVCEKLPKYLPDPGVKVWISQRKGEECVTLDLFSKKGHQFLTRATGSNVFQAFKKMKDFFKEIRSEDIAA
jgi:hypothetical protein